MLTCYAYLILFICVPDSPESYAMEEVPWGKKEYIVFWHLQ